MTVLIRDEFTGMADGEDIGGRTPSPTNTPGNTWTESGTNTVEGDGAGEIKVGGNQQNARIDAGITDMLVEVDFDPGGADNRSSIWVRGNDVEFAGPTVDMYFLRWKPGVTAADNLEILKKVDGASTTLSGTEVTLGTGTVRKYGLQVQGTSLKAYLDGTEVTALAVSDSDIDGTTEGGSYAGMVRNNWNSAAGRFDNFQVSDVTGGIHPWLKRRNPNLPR